MIKPILTSVFVAFLLTLYIPLSQAQTPLLAHSSKLYVGLFTTHLQTKGLNNHNNLIAIQSDNLILASFYNSYEKQSFAIAHHYPLSNHYGFYTGLVSGYDNQCWKVCPIITPYIKFNNIQLTLFGEAVNLAISFDIN